MHEERPVRDVYNLDVRQIVDGLDHLLGVLGVAGVDGDSPDGSLHPYPHDIYRPHQRTRVAHNYQDLAERPRLVGNSTLRVKL